MSKNITFICVTGIQRNLIAFKLKKVFASRCKFLSSVAAIDQKGPET